MKNKKSIGKVIVAAGSNQQREIEIKDFINSVYPDNRMISISNLEESAGYVVSVENYESSGRSSQKMWLSHESFMGLIATASLYLLHNKIDIEKEVEKMKGQEIEFKYAKR